jgi:UDP-N-acetylglucosamine--N-acetylmuramyl-(pentapeptide) pyrophosphoryl-undecaprenol N-acetylglucosamine transferase
LGLPVDQPCILIVGGSQGARCLNTWVKTFLESEKPPLGVSFIHITGDKDASSLRDIYSKTGVSRFVAPFYDAMGLLYRAGDLLVSRSGAGTVAEALVEGLPTVAVPYPNAALDHQRANALELERASNAIPRAPSRTFWLSFRTFTL